MPDHDRKAADIMASLLVQVLTRAEEENRHLYVWEREAIEWLREQWKRDKDTLINMWVAHRYVSNTNLDLLGRVSPEIVSRAERGEITERRK